MQEHLNSWLGQFYSIGYLSFDWPRFVFVCVCVRVCCCISHCLTTLIFISNMCNHIFLNMMTVNVILDWHCFFIH